MPIEKALLEQADHDIGIVVDSFKHVVNEFIKHHNVPEGVYMDHKEMVYQLSYELEQMLWELHEEMIAPE